MLEVYEIILIGFMCACVAAQGFIVIKMFIQELRYKKVKEWQNLLETITPVKNVPPNTTIEYREPVEGSG